MVYVLHHTGAGRAMLDEMTPAALKRAQAADPADGYPWHERVSGQRAHRWVRDDGLHSTPLYVGEDRHGVRRVLYARDSS